MTATKPIVIFRIPLREGVPVARSLRVAAGTYLTERGDAVTVPEQIGEVDGWRFSYPDMQVVLRVEVCIA